MKLTHSLGKFAKEVARALRNFQYEMTGTGIYIPRSRILVGGVFTHRHCPVGGEWGEAVVDPNRIVTQGLIQILNSALAGQPAITQFYLAPYTNNVEPDASWTGANFAAVAGEFTAYTLGTRLPWTTAPATTTPVVGNGASVAQLTFNSGGPYNNYGIGLLEASAKGATTGKLVAATLFQVPRVGMAGGDKLAYEYTVTAKDEADV